MRCNAEWCVGRTVSAIAVATFNNLEEETVAVGRAIELEIFAAVVAIVEHIVGAQAIEQIRVQR